MDTHKPAPLFPAPAGKICPICHKRAYSSQGIHPQCAVQQADAPRQKMIAAEKKEQARIHAQRVADAAL